MTPPQRKEERPVAALLAPDILAMLEESPQSVATETEEMHPADLADVAELLERDQVVALLSALPRDRAADVLEYLDEELRTEVLEALSTHQAAAIVGQMTPDDRADVLEELEEEHADEILDALPAEARRETEQLLSYEPNTAGGLMTTEFVSVHEDTPVEVALASVRALARTGRREAMYAIYPIDAQGRLHGVLSLRELLAAPDGARIRDIAWEEVVTVLPSADREEVARITANYDLLAVPVVNEDGVLLGVVTVDDVVDVIQEEQTEDVQKFGGMEALDEPYTAMGFWPMVRKRAGWLAALFIGEMLTATAMGHYEREIEKLTLLAIFVPLIISSGGNSGSQATSLIIRAMALDELRLRDWWRVALRELPSGLALGTILGLIGVVRIVSWQSLGLYDYTEGGRIAIGLVAGTVGLALVGVVTFGTLAGSMLPFVLRALRFDPASASAPFVATLVDVTGLVIYFSVAMLVLQGALH